MATSVDPISVRGLTKFSKDLKKLDNDLPKALRVALNEAGDVIVSDARPGVPRKSGKAQRSIKAKSTRKAVRVSGGGSRAPYYPWLDFGGRVGKDRSIRRPFLKDGRYIYRAYFDASTRDRFAEVLEKSLLKIAASAGVEVE